MHQCSENGCTTAESSDVHRNSRQTMNHVNMKCCNRSFQHQATRAHIMRCHRPAACSSCSALALPMHIQKHGNILRVTPMHMCNAKQHAYLLPMPGVAQSKCLLETFSSSVWSVFNHDSLRLIRTFHAASRVQTSSKLPSSLQLLRRLP